MTKIDIFSGFLGAGKTTLIKKLIKEAYVGEKLVLIENEFGEIGIDGGFLKEAGVEITEMNSGCICCSLVGDFTEALGKVLAQFSPDRILIEPSGVGKLSDVIRAVEKVASDDVKLNSFTTVVDATKCRIYMKNFGEFYNDQMTNAGCVVLSRTDGMAADKLKVGVAMIREYNAGATIITTPWSQLDGAQILAAMEQENTLTKAMHTLEHEDACPTCGGHHHDHKHHHDDDCHCHEHYDHEHHHDHDHHHHEHGEECHCHDHHHHNHHHADDVFVSWGVETTKTFKHADILCALQELDNSDKFGTVLRAKGIVAGADGQWIHFDFVPGAPDVRIGGADIIGRLCVIGAELNKTALARLFGIEEAC